ncbi:MAG: glycoside hydrolase family 25 protein [Bacteroidota bacterium]|nr:glycoside hydrolase family 25 protein [Bacteroidota bacterium]
MRKRIAMIVSMVIASHFTVSAQKTHKKSHGQRVHATHGQLHAHKKRNAHKIKDTRPEVTINDVKDLENLWGIDVSHHQSKINWEALESEKPHFMFIKASEGTTIQDEKYSTYYSEAKKLDIPVGSYHFFSYKSTGKEQADHFFSIAQHRTGDLLPVLDAEYIRRMPRDKEKITKELTDFVNSVYERLGFYPIIYCSYRYCQTYLSEEIQKKCKLWIADYKAMPRYEWTLWQTTNKFRLASIQGHVDLNFLNGNINNLKELFIKI